MMVPIDLQPLLAVRYLAVARAFSSTCLTRICCCLCSCFVCFGAIVKRVVSRTECAGDGAGAIFSLQKLDEHSHHDPCLWFSPLPSQDLRRARALFVDAVKFAVAAANSSMSIRAALQQLPDE
jgi:hypothetical protein